MPERKPENRKYTYLCILLYPHHPFLKLVIHSSTRYIFFFLNCKICVFVCVDQLYLEWFHQSRYQREERTWVSSWESKLGGFSIIIVHPFDKMFLTRTFTVTFFFFLVTGCAKGLLYFKLMINCLNRKKKNP